LASARPSPSFRSSEMTFVSNRYVRQNPRGALQYHLGSQIQSLVGRAWTVPPPKRSPVLHRSGVDTLYRTTTRRPVCSGR
jgi:hypothetical protein